MHNGIRLSVQTSECVVESVNDKMPLRHVKMKTGSSQIHCRQRCANAPSSIAKCSIGVRYLLGSAKFKISVQGKRKTKTNAQNTRLKNRISKVRHSSEHWTETEVGIEIILCKLESAQLVKVEAHVIFPLLVKSLYLHW